MVPDGRQRKRRDPDSGAEVEEQLMVRELQVVRVTGQGEWGWGVSAAVCRSLVSCGRILALTLLKVGATGSFKQRHVMILHFKI